MLAASMQCSLPTAPEWVGIAYGVLGRVYGAFSFDIQCEVEDVVGRWAGYIDAIPPLSPWIVVTKRSWKSVT